LKVEQQQIGTVDVLAPNGPLVDDEGDKFCKQLLQRVNSGNPRIVLAMQEVPYLDSAALESLLTASEQFQLRGSALKLAAVMPTCREIFELTGISGKFRFFKDVQDAVKSFL